MTIERWDPFSEMLTLRDAMSRLLEESFVWPSSMITAGTAGRMGLPIDLRETEDQYILEAALPGMRPEDVEITVQGNTISIRGEIKSDREQKGERYHLRERRSGQFQRSIALPDNVQADQASCDFNNGLLTLRLPKAEEARPRRITINTGGQQGEQARQLGEQG